MGLLSRNGRFRDIETDRTSPDRIINQLGCFGLQQARWSPKRLASGAATLRVRADGSMNDTLDVEQISNVRAAHAHLGAAGQSGPVVVPLFDRPAGVSVDRTRIAKVRGEVVPANGSVLSRYQDPALSWTYEVAPIGLGFVADDSLGRR